MKITQAPPTGSRCSRLTISLASVLANFRPKVQQELMGLVILELMTEYDSLNSEAIREYGSPWATVRELVGNSRLSCMPLPDCKCPGDVKYLHSWNPSVPCKDFRVTAEEIMIRSITEDRYNGLLRQWKPSDKMWRKAKHRALTRNPYCLDQARSLFNAYFAKHDGLPHPTKMALYSAISNHPRLPDFTLTQFLEYEKESLNIYDWISRCFRGNPPVGNWSRFIVEWYLLVLTQFPQSVPPSTEAAREPDDSWEVLMKELFPQNVPPWTEAALEPDEVNDWFPQDLPEVTEATQVRELPPSGFYDPLGVVVFPEISDQEQDLVNGLRLKVILESQIAAHKMDGFPATLIRHFGPENLARVLGSYSGLRLFHDETCLCAGLDVILEYETCEATRAKTADWYRKLYRQFSEHYNLKELKVSLSLVPLLDQFTNDLLRQHRPHCSSEL